MDDFFKNGQIHFFVLPLLALNVYQTGGKIFWLVIFLLLSILGVYLTCVRQEVLLQGHAILQQYHAGHSDGIPVTVKVVSEEVGLVVL